ncbi:MAG: class I SAM-dependent methyltransferase, partial [Pseudomonadota bacterium]
NRDLPGALGKLPGKWSLDDGVAVRDDGEAVPSYLAPFKFGPGSRQRARAASSQESAYFDLEAYHPMLDMLLASLPEGAIVGDVGCGDGRFTNYMLSRRPDILVVAADINSQNLKSLIDHLDADQAARVLPVLAPLEQFSDFDQFFDAIVALEVLYTLPNPESGYRTVASILRPDGYALVSNIAKSAYFVHALLNSDWQQIDRIVSKGQYLDHVLGDRDHPFLAKLYDEKLMREHAVQANLSLVASSMQSGAAALMLHAMKARNNGRPTVAENQHLLEKVNLCDLTIPRIYIDLLRNSAGRRPE